MNIIIILIIFCCCCLCILSSSGYYFISKNNNQISSETTKNKTNSLTNNNKDNSLTNINQDTLLQTTITTTTPIPITTTPIPTTTTPIPTTTIPPLYPFKSHTFLTAGMSGLKGPSLAQIKTAYSNTNWAQNTEFLNITKQGIQEWKVPISGNYTIKAIGAKGGNSSFGKGGLGVSLSTTVKLNKSDILQILVGQVGSSGNDKSGGGGGGTFVILNDQPIIIAGGGGGAGGYNKSSVTQDGVNATLTKSGANGYPGSGQWFIKDGVGGQNGNGGEAGESHRPGGGGGGFLSDGTSYTKIYGGGNYGKGGSSFKNGGNGGLGEDNLETLCGGFGGGGGGGLGGGGGGGYSGGGGGIWGGYTESDWGKGGGGGGSFTITNDFSTGTRDNDSDGKVIITLIN